MCWMWWLWWLPVDVYGSGGAFAAYVLYTIVYEYLHPDEEWEDEPVVRTPYTPTHSSHTPPPLPSHVAHALVVGSVGSTIFQQ